MIFLDMILCFFLFYLWVSNRNLLHDFDPYRHYVLVLNLVWNKRLPFPGILTFRCPIVLWNLLSLKFWPVLFYHLNILCIRDTLITFQSILGLDHRYILLSRIITTGISVISLLLQCSGSVLLVFISKLEDYCMQCLKIACSGWNKILKKEIE